MALTEATPSTIPDGISLDEHSFNARMKLAERVGALRGNIAAAIEYLKGVEDVWAKHALSTLTAAYEADTKRAG